MNLVKAFGDKPGFVSVDLSIHCALGPVDPSASDNFLPRRKGNQIPSLVLEEGVVFLMHHYCVAYMINIMHSLIINLGFIINKFTRQQ
jgi:hypothetical protein